MKKSIKNEKGLDFETAFKYPFNRAIRMWNILWLLFPIFGWFALGGYGVRITKEFSEGKFKQLPKMKFGKDMKLGFVMFLKAIPFIVLLMVVFGILSVIPVFGILIEIFVDLFVLPMMFIHFINKQTVESLFEFRIIENVLSNVGEYLMAILKSIGLGLIFFVMIIVLVGIPASQFTKNIFLADFYRRNIK